ncbi:MAG: glycosyltransferase [Spirochaetota bacterium]|nr:glycosyltransferase [Spirochaetota bacterium]
MKISVYITSYNQKEYLKEAIESVLDQTLAPYEIIIVDDCSKDGSQDLIADYVDRYPDVFKAIYHRKNLGVTQSRIDALNAVSGDYVSYLDGDDRYLPDKLELESRLLKDNPDRDIAFSNFRFINSDGSFKQNWADTDDPPPEGNVFAKVFSRQFPKKILFRNELVNYKAWVKIGFHDPEIDLYEDYELRIRLSKDLKVIYQNEVQSEYRIHEDGLSKAKLKDHIEALNYIYNKNKVLLNDLSISEKRQIKKDLFKWLAMVSQMALEQELNEKSGIGSLISVYYKYLKWQSGLRASINTLVKHKKYSLYRILKRRI